MLFILSHAKISKSQLQQSSFNTSKNLKMGFRKSTKNLNADGEPIKIIEPQSDHTFKLNSNALKDILLSDELKHKKVVVISITGAFRTGKSFLLNFLLAFLKKTNSRSATQSSKFSLVYKIRSYFGRSVLENQEESKLKIFRFHRENFLDRIFSEN